MWVDVHRSPHVRHKVHLDFGPVSLLILSTLLFVEIVAISWEDSEDGFGSDRPGF